MGIQTCHPASEQFLNEEALKHYSIHNIELQPEKITVTKHFLNRKRKDIVLSIQSIFSLLDGDMSPSLKAIFQSSLIIPHQLKLLKVVQCPVPTAHMAEKYSRSVQAK